MAGGVVEEVVQDGEVAVVVRGEVGGEGTDFLFIRSCSRNSYFLIYRPLLVRSDDPPHALILASRWPI